MTTLVLHEKVLILAEKVLNKRNTREFWKNVDRKRLRRMTRESWTDQDFDLGLVVALHTLWERVCSLWSFKRTGLKPPEQMEV